MLKTKLNATTASAIALAATACAAITMLLGPAWAAASPNCPSSWPGEQQLGAVPDEQYGRISHDGFHTDSNGERWYVIRGTDSSGNTHARAYPADDRYPLGYSPSAPHETCYAKLRRSGDAADHPEPEQVIFSREPDDPVDATSVGVTQPPDAGEPATLREILAGMSDGERAAAILCLVGIAGNADPDAFLDDPANVQFAIDAGCIPPQ